MPSYQNLKSFNNKRYIQFSLSMILISKKLLELQIIVSNINIVWLEKSVILKILYYYHLLIWNLNFHPNLIKSFYNISKIKSFSILDMLNWQLNSSIKFKILQANIFINISKVNGLLFGKVYYLSIATFWEFLPNKKIKFYF